eukprot:m.75845 g.75845  ORF g.75845 m.75845 type:complete len:1086 (-) comp12462_c0_seq2:179-3436(-)
MASPTVLLVQGIQFPLGLGHAFQFTTTYIAVPYHVYTSLSDQDFSDAGVVRDTSKPCIELPACDFVAIPVSNTLSEDASLMQTELVQQSTLFTPDSSEKSDLTPTNRVRISLSTDFAVQWDNLIDDTAPLQLQECVDFTISTTSQTPETPFKLFVAKGTREFFPGDSGTALWFKHKGEWYTPFVVIARKSHDPTTVACVYLPNVQQLGLEYTAAVREVERWASVPGSAQKIDQAKAVLQCWRQTWEQLDNSVSQWLGQNKFELIAGRLFWKSKLTDAGRAWKEDGWKLQAEAKKKYIMRELWTKAKKIGEANPDSQDLLQEDLLRGALQTVEFGGFQNDQCAVSNLERLSNSEVYRTVGRSFQDVERESSAKAAMKTVDDLQKQLETISSNPIHDQTDRFRKLTAACTNLGNLLETVDTNDIFRSITNTFTILERQVEIATCISESIAQPNSGDIPEEVQPDLCSFIKKVDEYSNRVQKWHTTHQHLDATISLAVSSLRNLIEFVTDDIEGTVSCQTFKQALQVVQDASSVIYSVPKDPSPALQMCTDSLTLLIETLQTKALDEMWKTWNISKCDDHQHKDCTQVFCKSKLPIHVKNKTFFDLIPRNGESTPTVCHHPYLCEAPQNSFANGALSKFRKFSGTKVSMHLEHLYTGAQSHCCINPTHLVNLRKPFNDLCTALAHRQFAISDEGEFSRGFLTFHGVSTSEVQLAMQVLDSTLQAALEEILKLVCSKHCKTKSCKHPTQLHELHPSMLGTLAAASHGIASITGDPAGKLKSLKEFHVLLRNMHQTHRSVFPSNIVPGSKLWQALVTNMPAVQNFSILFLNASLISSFASQVQLPIPFDMKPSFATTTLPQILSTSGDMEKEWLGSALPFHASTTAESLDLTSVLAARPSLRSFARDIEQKHLSLWKLEIEITLATTAEKKEKLRTKALKEIRVSKFIFKSWVQAGESSTSLPPEVLVHNSHLKSFAKAEVEAAEAEAEAAKAEAKAAKAKAKAKQAATAEAEAAKKAAEQKAEAAEAAEAEALTEASEYLEGISKLLAQCGIQLPLTCIPSDKAWKTLDDGIGKTLTAAQLEAIKEAFS